LTLHVDELLARVEVSVEVLKLFLKVGLEAPFEILLEDLLVESESVLNLSYILEVRAVRDSQTLHAVSVAPFLEVFFKSTAAPVRGTTTNLTLEFLAKAVQLVQPVRNGFAVPAHRQRLRIVLSTIIIIVIIQIIAIATIDLQCCSRFR